MKSDTDDIDECCEYANATYNRLKIMDSEPGPIEVSLVELDRKTKAKLYPRVRNKFNVNKPIYESQGTVYVNPNTFIRVKMVLDEIQRQ